MTSEGDEVEMWGRGVRGNSSEVWKSTGIFFVVTGNCKNGLVEFIVTELLKGHGGSDGGEHGDVCTKKNIIIILIITIRQTLLNKQNTVLF